MRNAVKKLWCCGAKSKVVKEGVAEEGRIRVCVGKEAQYKLELEANLLNHRLFEDLLRVSEEEFGYSYDGALRISCEIDVFQHLIHLLQSRNPSAHYMQLQDLISNFYSGNFTSNLVQ